MPTPAEIYKSTERLLKNMEEVERRINKADEGFVNLYLETVPRSFIKITVEDDAKRQQSRGNGPWTFKDHETGKMITVRRAACGLPGCMCAMALVRVDKVGESNTYERVCHSCDEPIEVEGDGWYVRDVVNGEELSFHPLCFLDDNDAGLQLTLERFKDWFEVAELSTKIAKTANPPEWLSDIADIVDVGVDAIQSELRLLQTEAAQAPEKAPGERVQFLDETDPLLPGSSPHEVPNA